MFVEGRTVVHLWWLTRRLRIVGTCSLALLLVTLTPAIAASTSWSVQAGGGSPDQAVQAMLFFPGTITIDVGDGITWNDGSAEPHTISFGVPPASPGAALAPAGGTSYDGTAFTSSGLLLPIPGHGYTLTFMKAGTYHYLCLIHPASMRGAVVVQPAGSPYPTAQTTYTAATAPLLSATISAGEASIPAQQVATRANGDGTTTYYENMGAGNGKSFSIERFGVQNLSVHVGDTVVWTQLDPNENHTVTFLNNGQDIPPTLPNGQPNPQEAAPAGGQVYGGTGLFSSGFVPVNHSYALTFSKAGTYQYVCLLHDTIGMKAAVTVLPKAASVSAYAPTTAGAGVRIPAQLPNTGAGGGSGFWGGLLLLGLLVLGLGARAATTPRS